MTTIRSSTLHSASDYLSIKWKLDFPSLAFFIYFSIKFATVAWRDFSSFFQMSLTGKKTRDPSNLPTLSYEIPLKLPTNVDSQPQEISFLDLITNDAKFVSVVFLLSVIGRAQDGVSPHRLEKWQGKSRTCVEFVRQSLWKTKCQRNSRRTWRKNSDWTFSFVVRRKVFFRIRWTRKPP